MFALFRSVVEDLVRSLTRGTLPPRARGRAPEFAALFHRPPRAPRTWDPELVWEEIRSIVKGAKLPLNPGRLEALAASFAAGTLRPRERSELAESLLGLEPLAVGARLERLLAVRTPPTSCAG